MNNLLIENGGFTEYSTEGYSESELLTLNESLDDLLHEIEYGSQEYYAICSSFSDEIGRM